MDVLIVCPNPAVDRTWLGPRLRPGRRQAPERSWALAGGKGFNAARALKTLGVPARVLAFSAGLAGRWLEAAAAREGLRAEWVRLPRGETRTCLTVLDGGEPTELNEEGPRAGPAQLARLLALFRRRLPRARAVLLCGSLPPGAPAAFAGEVVALARAAGRWVAADTRGPALAAALRARPDLVCPNLEEARGLGLRGPPRRLLAGLDGAREACLTLGERGAVARTEEGRFLALPPRARPAYPTGCGDAFLAGWLAARLAGLGGREALRLAAACGAANAVRPGAGVLLESDRRRFVRMVRLRCAP